MTEVDAFGHPFYALRSDGDRAVDVLRDRSRRSGLLPDQAPVTNEHRIRRIAQVVDLATLFPPPCRKRWNGRREACTIRYEIGDSRVAFPVAFVCVCEIRDDSGYEFRIARVGNVIDLVRAARRPEQVDLSLVCIRQITAVTGPDHLRAARFTDSRAAGEMFEIARTRGMGNIDDRGSFWLHAV